VLLSARQKLLIDTVVTALVSMENGMLFIKEIYQRKRRVMQTEAYKSHGT